MSPKLKVSKGGLVEEEDRDERAGIEAGSGAFTGKESRVEFSAGGGADGVRLPPGEAAVEALPSARGEGIGAWERGAGVEPGEAEKFAAAGAGAAAEEVWGRSGRALWADAGGGALGGGRRDRTGGGNAARLD